MSFERKDTFTFVGMEDYDEDEKLYCPWCSRVGVKIELKEKVFDENELPYDAADWLQCYRCGKSVHITQSKEEGEYAPIVDVLDNPYDSGSEFMAPDPRAKKPKRNKLKDHKINPVVAKELQGEHGEINVLEGLD